MRRTGELSINEAAEMLEVHPDTVRNWAQRALSGSTSRLQQVRIDVTGRYWIALSDVRHILKLAAESNAIS